jgi:tetratricopeptide (TPR) repeat protein
MCALVIGVYAYTAHTGYSLLSTLNPADDYYNLLVQGFRAGQLSLKKEVPPGLARLADPYDPAAHSPYPVLDLSYYKGRLYLYFGITPALVLFWPFVALTGHYLSEREAVVIFSAIGFLASVGLLRVLWRRYFPEVSVWVVAACALALGLATAVPVMLPRSAYNEVAISCGYMLTMLMLAAIWCALHEPERRCRWLAAASMAYGLAVGARASLLFGAVILLVPVVQTWRERQRAWMPLIAAIGPIALVGLGLTLYNALRFGSPFEFGQHYQLTGVRSVTQQHFLLRYLWFNFRVYFLEPARWSGRFPFVHDIAVPPLPVGYDRVETPFGVLTNIPLVWLALAVPLGWRSRPAEARSSLCGFLTAVALLFGICALTLAFFCAATNRYEVDFLPSLLLLTAVGILGLEHALADQPVRRRVVRWGWSLLLSFSVAFNLLASVERCAEAHNILGMTQQAAGQMQKAMGQYKQALRLKPDFAEAHNNLGVALVQQGRLQEAIGHYEQALQIKPDLAGAHYNLGLALIQQGRLQEAIVHYEQALRIKPDDAGAHCNLANALLQASWVQEAIVHYEQALRLQPDYAEAHNNLGVALVRLGRVQEAIAHYEQALRIKPDYAEAHNNLGLALVQQGRLEEAIVHYEQALRLKPDYAKAHNNLGHTLVQQGRLQEAIDHYEQALRINPDFTQAQNALARLQARR